jgi:hypothetical protein
MLLAQDLNTIQSGAFPKASSLEQTTIGGIITNLLPYIFGAAAIALLIYLILGGFQLMTSQGDPKAAQSAQGKITNAIIGFVIIILAFFIVQLAGQLLGIEGTVFGNIFGTN